MLKIWARGLKIVEAAAHIQDADRKERGYLQHCGGLLSGLRRDCALVVQTTASTTDLVCSSFYWIHKVAALGHL